MLDGATMLKRVDLPIDTFAVASGVKPDNEFRRMLRWREDPDRYYRLHAWCMDRFRSYASRRGIVIVGDIMTLKPDLAILDVVGHGRYYMHARAIQWPDDVPRRDGLRVRDDMRVLSLPVVVSPW